MFIDTHAHLNYPEIKKDLPEILDRAKDAGVDCIIVPATNYVTSLDVIELAEKYEMLYAAVGIHPTELKDFKDWHFGELEKLCEHDKVAAVGEVGLDYYWKPYDKELEQKVLKVQLGMAKRKNLPVILHNRESSEDLIQIVSESRPDVLRGEGKLRGQFHSFSGDTNMAEKCIEMGFFISFTGNITYKPNENTLRAYEALNRAPLENLLLETDSPFLPPVPYRGKQNEPAYLKYTAEKIAELKGISVEELGKVTSENAGRLFNI